ncbi:ATP-binding protein [uncultured Jatrophihabitans sp.]|uniref:sensor histidine kinase n=1 Tax=uncultured Jatrophihabitans sp. TaxID=1610747 RepID=UPI0035CB6802
MSRSRDSVVPAIAAAVVVAVAISVVVLLRTAANRGVDALTRAKLEQVQTTASSFDARVAAQLTSASGLGTASWQLTPDSTSDNRILKSYAVDPAAQSGFFLVNAQGSVTAGVLLRPGVLGSSYSPVGGWASVKQRLVARSAFVLPATRTGLTTELPKYDFVVAIRGANGKGVRGALVFEQAISATSAFETEIAKLADNTASSVAWYFIDSRGTVVADTRPSGLGRPVENDRYRTLPEGVAHVDGRIVVSADVPSIGWRIVFREDSGQFEKALSGPLQQVGLILVLLLLGVGLLLFTILMRRLRDAREQQKRLRALNRSQAEFVSVVSHELRTPVAGILGFLQTTVDHWPALSDSDRLETVQRAVANARRLQAMARDVLDAETIGSGRFGYSFARIELGSEVRTAVAAAGDVDPTRRVVITGATAPVWVDADPDRLQQVLGNLLENARNNSPAGEPVTVQTEVLDAGTDEPGRVRVSVIDHGPGVDADTQERIFEKFSRGSDDAVTGTGLGLYIARTVVEAHHGRIWCESDPGVRTAFIVELPIAQHEHAHEPVSV